ncbi:MAG: hypothetical protein PHF44_03370 [Candidatus Pacebacteria bacterium]|nr:hypothetical protein [Candidatus Paceibacterota bacterium]
MFISIIFFVIIAVICMFAVVYAKARNVKQKHIADAEKRGDLQEANRLKDMSEDEAADEFDDEMQN